MGKSLGEWIEENGMQDLQREVECHLMCASSCTPEEVVDVTRLIMISIRQKFEKEIK